MLRCDVAKTDKWRIEDIYEDDAAWQSDYECFADELNKGLQYRGRLLNIHLLNRRFWQLTRISCAAG